MARGQPRRRHADGNDDGHDLPTLLDIFQFLESPDPQPYASNCLASEYGDIFQACLAPGTYHGMRTCLYMYQKNAVFKMLRRELLPDLFLDPTFSPVFRAAGAPHGPGRPQNNNSGSSSSGNGGSRYTHPLLPYLQFSHGIGDSANPWIYERQSEPGVAVAADSVSWYGSARGGIVCEDMGTGKTCECLALCLLTKRQMARPPMVGETIPCVGTVTSPLRTDYCPISERDSSADPPRHVPSLKLLAARTALLGCAESLRVMHDDGVVPDAIWRDLEPHPAHYWIDPVSDGRPKRGLSATSIEQMSFKVYISSATIAVVPDNLVDQWVREKYKHIEDNCGLEVLKLDSSTETVPRPEVLLKYDLVLVSVGRLAKEYIPIDSRLGELRQSCRCHSRGFEQCICHRRVKDATYRSPLLCVHWKRLIVDEGHIMSSRNTARALMATYLIAERRWVCTGTPTHNLVNASLAPTSAQPASNGPDGEAMPPPAGSRHQIGARESSADFLQLGVLVSMFLRMDPFARSTSAWTSAMVVPYKNGDAGGRQRLRALLQSIMVRNRPETVANEVQLPPLHERTVSLRPTQLQALTYNTVVAFFHINAILTEREGRDYFFHPDNKKHLRQLVANFFCACSWFPASLKHIHDGIANGEAALRLYEAGAKPYSPDDVSLLHQCIAELRRAVSDGAWAFAVQADSAPFQVSGIPHKLGGGLFALPGDAESDPGHAQPEHLATAAQLLGIAARAKEMLATADDGLPLLRSNLDPHEFDSLRAARVGACGCSKIAYLVASVQRCVSDEKCIVFVCNPGDAALVDDALRLARIPHLLYVGAATTQNERRHNITTFSTSTWFNVMVMDVHLAAYGIDLSAASRVWFMSPVWQPARERQAIKRAHRLGQRRPVHVETLLTEGSIEQALWARRQELASDATRVVPRDIEDDGKMRSVLSNARFIEGGDDASAGPLGLPVLPPAVRYPPLLQRKYDAWRAEPATLPFPKTRRLVLQLRAPDAPNGM
ncbi:hypothetical protein H4R19_003093 [Coemansia spiralis]|nr:hypothetical protein H4R19_003093 [Coemansia spiralis]